MATKKTTKNKMKDKKTKPSSATSARAPKVAAKPKLAAKPKPAAKPSAKKSSTAKTKTAPAAKANAKAKATAKANAKATATANAKVKAKKFVVEAPAVVVKPKKPARANKPPLVPHQKTILQVAPPPPPKPKATISKAKAVTLANTFLKENVGRAALYAPPRSRFRVANVVDRNGIINIHFAHELDADLEESMTTLGTKCLEALLVAHPQLKAFEIEVQTIRM